MWYHKSNLYILSSINSRNRGLYSHLSDVRKIINTPLFYLLLLFFANLCHWIYWCYYISIISNYLSQQSGDAKKPYLVQYSVVCEDKPVTESWTNMNTNKAIKIILNPLNIHFNAFLTEVFLARVDNIIINQDIFLFYIILFYIINIVKISG
jgi:hypothetical protein